MSPSDPADREISEPGIVGRMVVVVVAAIAAITLLGWITFGAAGGLFDDDEPCEGVDCPPTTSLVDDTGDGADDGTTIAPTGEVPGDSAPSGDAPTDEAPPPPDDATDAESP